MNGQDKIIFVADDNENDRYLLNEALTKTNLPFKIIYAENGKELLTNLENFYAKNQAFPKMILLDLDDGVKKEGDPTGLETLQTIKSHFLYKTIPVLALSSEKSNEKVVKSYNLGANSFIVKPATHQGFEDFVKTLNTYWFELAAI